MKFKLHKPINGTKIYYTDSIKKAAHKCFSELRSKQNKDRYIYSIINIDTNKEYAFLGVNPYSVQKGGHKDIEFLNKLSKLSNSVVSSATDLKKLINSKNDNRPIIFYLEKITNSLEETNKRLIELDKKLFPKIVKVETSKPSNNVEKKKEDSKWCNIM